MIKDVATLILLFLATGYLDAKFDKKYRMLFRIR